MKPSLRIVFAGTPDFSVAPLKALLASAHEVVAVYTQPDRPAGRGRKLTASPVKEVALEHGIPVYQPETLRNEDAQAELAALNADLMIVVAYGLILPKAVLEMPTYGCLNIHASLLPRWRGAAPIQRAIEAGDAASGVTIMQMDVGLDTGDMLYKVTTPIAADDSAQSLHDRLSILGADALMATLADLAHLQAHAQKQDETLVTYAEKLNKAEAEINWDESAETIVRKIHAFNPWPMAFTDFQGQPLRILSAHLATENTPEKTAQPNSTGRVLAVEKQGILIGTGSTPIWVTQLQPPSKKPMAAYDFAQSRQLVGTQFA